MVLVTPNMLAINFTVDNTPGNNEARSKTYMKHFFQ